MSSLTLANFSDQDLLWALEAAADEEGWATSEEIAQRIGLEHDRPTQCVGIRLGWLKRFGWMDHEKEGSEPARWRLNDKGYSLLHPHKLSAAAQKALDSLDDGQRAAVTQIVARGVPRGSREAAHMTRRIWGHHMAGWRDASIAPKRSTAKTRD